MFYVIETCEPRAECEAMFSRGDGLALERRSQWSHVPSSPQCFEPPVNRGVSLHKIRNGDALGMSSPNLGSVHQTIQ